MGVAPIACASSAWLRRTAASSSPSPARRFMLPKGPALKPPWRVVMTAPTPGTCQAGSSQSGCIGAGGRLRRHEGVVLHALAEDAHHRGDVIEPAVHALRIEDLRH